MPEQQPREWTDKRRATWWLKYVMAVAAGVITLAGAGRVLGLRFDVQTQTEAQAQHEQMRRETAEQVEAVRRESNEQMAKAVEKVEKAIDRLGTRLDSAFSGRGRGERR